MDKGLCPEAATAYRRDHYLTKAEKYMISLSTDYYMGGKRRQDCTKQTRKENESVKGSERSLDFW